MKKNVRGLDRLEFLALFLVFVCLTERYLLNYAVVILSLPLHNHYILKCDCWSYSILFKSDGSLVVFKFMKNVHGHTINIWSWQKMRGFGLVWLVEILEFWSGVLYCAIWKCPQILRDLVLSLSISEMADMVVRPSSPPLSVSLLAIKADTRLVLKSFLRNSLAVPPGERPGRIGGEYHDPHKYR